MDACRSLKAPATGAGLDVVAPSSPRPCAADIELARLGLVAQALQVALVILVAVIISVTAATPVHAAIWAQIDSESHAAPIVRLAADPARDIVVTGSDDKTARVWSLSTGRQLAVLHTPVGAGRIGRVFGVAIHPRDDLVAVAGSASQGATPAPSIWLFELSTGRYVRRFEARGEHVRRLTWSDDGRLLFACFAEPGALRAFGGDGALVYEEMYAADCFTTTTRGSRLAAATRDNRVELYRLGERSITRDLGFRAAGDPLGLAFSPDGGRIAVAYFTPGLGSGVYRTDNGESLLRLSVGSDRQNPVAGDPISKSQAIVWSADGKVITTGGSMDLSDRVDGRIRRFDAASGRLLSELTVSADSVTDLVALDRPGGDPSALHRPALDRPALDRSATARTTAAVTPMRDRTGEVAWAGFAGDWGLARAQDSTVSATPRIEFLIRRGAAELRVSGDASTVRWLRGARRVPISFNVANRHVGTGSTDGLRGPVTRRGLFDSAERFENNFGPLVRGSTVRMVAGEISRALSYVGDDGHVVLATSLGLRRLDRSLNTVWQVDTATEVRAVNVSSDGRLVITTLSDGTVRWWRSEDGQLLLTLLTTRDGWVLWTPTGHYDASPGAENLLGWLVDRDDGVPVPDYFSVGRFRERFNRPDVIDRVLGLRDPAEAVRQADAARGPLDTALATRYRPQAGAAAGTTGAAPAGATGALTSGPAVDEIRPTEAPRLPPVLAALESLRIAVTGAVQTFRFSIRAFEGGEPPRIEARVDGRLVDPRQLRLPARLDGQSPAEITLPFDGSVESVQIIARSDTLASEPLRFRVDGNRVRPLEPSLATGTLHALVIGIGHYQRRDVPALVFPAKDAGDFAAAIRDQRGRLYRDAQFRILTDAEATRDKVLEGLAWLRDTVKAEDSAIVFLAGHGVNTAGGRYLFLPADADLKQLPATTIDDRSIIAALGSVRGRALLFLDTCFAGAVADSFANTSRETSRFVNSLATPENSVSVFASSTGREESLEQDSWGNGAFTKILVEGLRGGAQLRSLDVVTSGSLGPFLATGVPRLTEGGQTPVTVIPDSLPDRILTVTGGGLPGGAPVAGSVVPVSTSSPTPRAAAPIGPRAGPPSVPQAASQTVPRAAPQRTPSRPSEPATPSIYGGG